MACPQCGRAVAEQDRFCGGCGSALADTCRRCGRPVGAAVAFCTGCGTPRRESQTDPAPAEDRRRISVLFIDLVDSTPYAEQADPELVRLLQSRFYTTARQVIRRYGGVVEKYIGDAVMALFGAPVATETDPVRCVRAALDLQRLLSDRSDDAPGWHDQPDPGPHFRAGVATGEGLVDLTAAHDGGQAIVAGDVVNTAFRLQSLAPAGGVLVCGQTYDLTRAAVRYAEQTPVTLRGRSAPTDVWLALSPVPRQQADAEPDLTPLVERKHELGVLTGALHRVVRDRTPQLVTIFGRAGIGKSRLVRELRRRADELADEPVTWRIGQCPPFGEDLTYAALSDIVKGQAGILETDSAPIAASRLAYAVRDVVPDPEADRLIDALGPLVGLSDPGLPAEEAASAWRRFLVEIAAHRPTVLVFEDLHWADESMLRFIELLAAAAQDVPLLVLGTARPELTGRDASWAGAIAGSLTITLPPLRPQGVTRLYQHLFGQLAFSADLLRPLVERADGNPLYAHEYVRMLVQHGATQAGSDGAVRAGSDGATRAGSAGAEETRAAGGGLALPIRLGDGEELPTPDSVQSVIANRVDLLAPDDRAVLQAAAVVGMQFWPGAVAAALVRPVSAVERALRALEQREFVAEQLESTKAGHREFRFRHVLVRDICYQRLPRTERIARHDRTADWLEKLPYRRDTDLAGVLAHHRWTAHELARSLRLPAADHARAARRALQAAARRAYALHALEAAAGHVARASELFEPAPGAGEEPERLRLDLFATEIDFYRHRSAFLAGDGEQRLQALADRLTAITRDQWPAGADPLAAGADPLPAGAPGDRPATGADDQQVATAAAAARSWTLLGQVARLRADRDAAVRCLGRAVSLFDPLPDSPEKVDAYSELGRLHMLSYECDPAIAAATTAAATAGRLGLVEAQATARITIATARYESGDPAGLSELREVTAQCRGQQLLALRRATRNLAYLVREEGDWQVSEELLAECRQLDGPGGHNVLTSQTGDAMRAYFTGDFDTLAGDPLTPDDPARDAGWEERRDLRACVRALRGDPAAATDAAAALAASRRTGFHRTLWPVLAAAALCQAVQGHDAEARELLAELAGEWRKVPVIASGEWICKAAYAAALTGTEPAEALRVPLADAPWRTPWAEAALHTVTGVVTLARGEPAAAGREHLAAAAIHERTPAVTDQLLSLALAAAAFTVAGEPERAGPALTAVQEFATRNRAPGLIRIAQPRS